MIYKLLIIVVFQNLSNDTCYTFWNQIKTFYIFVFVNLSYLKSIIWYIGKCINYFLKNPCKKNKSIVKITSWIYICLKSTCKNL